MLGSLYISLVRCLIFFSADIKSTWRWWQTLFNSSPGLFWWIRTGQISLFEMFGSKIITTAIKLFRIAVIHLSASLEYCLSNSNWSAEGKSGAEKNSNVFWKEHTWCKFLFYVINLQVIPSAMYSLYDTKQWVFFIDIHTYNNNTIYHNTYLKA